MPSLLSSHQDPAPRQLPSTHQYSGHLNLGPHSMGLVGEAMPDSLQGNHAELGPKSVL